MLSKNSGVLIRVKPTDFRVGAESGIIFESRTDGDWSLYKPTDELQYNKYFDSMACVTFSALNIIEFQVNWMIMTNKIPEEKVLRMKELGYIDENGRFNCSDRFTAYMSGTTKNGNYLDAVWDSICKHGLLPEKDWKFEGDFDWDKYYEDPGQERKDKAKLILEILEIKYEWVLTGAGTLSQIQLEILAEHSKQAPLQIAAPVCPGWNSNTVILPCGKTQSEHATAIHKIGENIHDYDHYVPFEKVLSKYYYIPYVMKGVVTLKKEPVVAPVEKFSFHFTHSVRLGDNCLEVKQLQKALQLNGCFPSTVNTTGYYGTITQLAVRKFQEKYKLANMFTIRFINGRWTGPATIKKLNQLYS